MNKAAAIQAQLVDIRNIGHDKCVKLTLHVPAEQAPLVLKAFGWPTAIDPVPVALARLTQPKESEAQPRPPLTESPSNAGGAHTKKSWNALTPAQQAGILCNEVSFHKFCSERAPNLWIYCSHDVADPDQVAAEFVRSFCGVESRAQLTPGMAAWNNIVSGYRAWMREPAVVG